MTRVSSEGQLFRLNYARPIQPLPDSIRARRRVLQLFMRMAETDRTRFVKIAQSELGVEYPGSYGWNHDTYWTKCELSDFLSSITLFCLTARGTPNLLKELKRIFEEEHLRYRIDANGGVHFLIDMQFEQSLASTIAGLGNERFRGAKQVLEQTFAQIDPANPSGKSIVRGIFEVVETVFLLEFGNPQTNRINKDAIEKLLKPALLKDYANVPDSEDKVKRICELITSWINCAHPFRHGAAVEEVHEAPIDFATIIADNGLSILRFLIASR